VRLRGHGTSPWDLLERSREDWLASVREGYEVLEAFAGRLCLVGFSAGGTLALRLAAEAPAGLAGVVAVSAPVKWRDPTMGLVPVLHGVNVLSRAVSSGAGLKPFHHVPPEHSHINYLHKPVRALYELNRLIAELEGRLAQVRCPVLLVQGTDDPTVDPRSGELLRQGLVSAAVTLLEVPSARHGILYEDVGGTQVRVAEFLAQLEAAQ
jgi:esterase/lipase